MIKPMVVLCVAVAVLAAGGCAAAPDREEGTQLTTSATPVPDDGPVISSQPPPTLASPSQPSSGKVSPPSDLQPTGFVVGRIVRGGSGPCYGVETDDGKLYAVYSTKAGTLAVGATVRIKTAPLLLKIYCGEGEHVSGVSVEVI